MPAYIYVYSPLTAKSLGRDCYCYCCWDCNRPCRPTDCTHISGGTAWGYPNPGFPIDIGGSSIISAGAGVRFYGTVDSIRTRQRTDFCASNPGAPYEDAVEVELYRYANAYCYIGKLFYGHLYDRIPNGVYNYPDGLLLGKVPSCCPACNCCYFGLHVHVSRDSSGESNTDIMCDNMLYAGSTWIYRWIDSGRC